MMIGEHNRQQHQYSPNSYTTTYLSNNHNSMNHYQQQYGSSTMSQQQQQQQQHRYLNHHFYNNPAVNSIITTTSAATTNNNNPILSSSPSSPLSLNSLLETSPPNTPRGTYLLTDYETILAALSRYLPSNTQTPQLGDTQSECCDLNAAKYSTDEFRMYEFKVRGCTRAKAHDWTECPFAHPGEKARRRDPRLYAYTGTACTDFRKGSCRRGDSCEFAHGVFECWLHPSRYRTQACKDGRGCRRRVCFFAHTPEELRVLASPRGGGGGSTTGDPFLFDEAVGGCGGGFQQQMDSPPLTPMGSSSSRSAQGVMDLAASLRNLQLEKVKSMPVNRVVGGVPSAASSSAAVVGSPPSSLLSGGMCGSPPPHPGYYSLPATPTSRLGSFGYNNTMLWCETEGEDDGSGVVVQRVESGRELRAKMFEKLSKENPLGRVLDYPATTAEPAVASGPDVGWVSDLLQ